VCPSINGVKIKIYKQLDTAEKHEFRETTKYLDRDYELLKTLKAQPVWYSAEQIAFKEEIMNFSSLGYFIFKASSLKALGISPAPDGRDWASYRLCPYINGSYSEKWLNIVEVRQESPWRSSFRLWYIYFDSVRVMPVIPTTSNPIEERGIDDISAVVTVVREH